MIAAKELIGTHDILLMTLDTLRYDVAVMQLEAGHTPALATHIKQWEQRHTAGSFTYAAHHAFFAGFLPSPASPGRHPRLFATAFPSSETTTERTAVFDAPDIVTGLAQAGYHTVCIGGVGFFDKRSPLGSVLPGLFAESHWSPEMGINGADSTRHQVSLGVRILASIPTDRRVFLFVNVSAIHQPNHMFQAGATSDSIATHAAALRYVDRHLPPLFAALQRRGPTLCVICADHGTTYGEDGYFGHRIGHPLVWQVPYAEFILPSLARP
jgi:hypothetical protein